MKIGGGSRFGLLSQHQLEAVKPVTPVAPATGLHSVLDGPNENNPDFEAALVRAANQQSATYDQPQVSAPKAEGSLGEEMDAVTLALQTPPHERTQLERAIVETEMRHRALKR